MFWVIFSCQEHWTKYIRRKKMENHLTMMFYKVWCPLLQKRTRCTDVTVVHISIHACYFNSASSEFCHESTHWDMVFLLFFSPRNILFSPIKVGKYIFSKIVYACAIFDCVWIGFCSFSALFRTRHVRTYIYDMGFPSSQRHYFQPLWTMWNRLNIHTHSWAQRVRPISNCHRTFIFIPHPGAIYSDSFHRCGLY